MVKVQPIGVAGVSDILDGRAMPALQMRGKFGASVGFGELSFGLSNIGDNRASQGIYQKRVTGYNQTGRIASRPRKVYYVKMKSYRPTNPQTPAQQAHRQKFADAVAIWQGLTPVEKSVYNDDGKRRNKIPRCLFISEYMRSH